MKTSSFRLDPFGYFGIAIGLYLAKRTAQRGARTHSLKIRSLARYHCASRADCWSTMGYYALSNDFAVWSGVLVRSG